MNEMPTRVHQVRLITSESEILSLEEPWTRLAKGIAEMPVFLTWEWISTWWRHYKQDGKLWVATAWDAHGNLIGVVPWILRRRSLSTLGLRRLEFMIYRPAAHLDVIASPEHCDAVCDAFVGYLTRGPRKWDVLDLRGLAANSMLKRHLENRNSSYRDTEGLSIPYISLPGSWQDFEMKSLSHHRRHQVRSFRRRLEKDYPGRVSYETITEPSELPHALETIIEMNRRKWEGRNLWTPFDEPRHRAFHHELSALALERGWLRFYQLKVDEEVISSLYCFLFHKTLFAYTTAFDMNWSNYHPGELLLPYVIQEAIADGARELDFGPYTYRWKQSWATDTREERHVVFGHGWRGSGWLAGTALMDWSISTGRRMVPDSARERVNHFISRVKHGQLRNVLERATLL